MGGELLINVDDVSREFGSHHALSNISFTLLRGEVLGFLGPNGAGKSTTMRIICGVLSPTSGRVTIAGYDIVEDATRAKTHLGFLPEHPPLYTDQTVDEYLGYCALLHHIPKTRRATAVDNAKQRCGLESVGHRLIGNLSKGFQQRTGIAQAIIHSPPVIILDEPTIGLDPNQIIEIRGLIRELGEDHSVILSSHILTEIQTTCQRVIIINEGRLVLDQPLHTLRGDTGYENFSIALENPPLPEDLEQLEGVTVVAVIDRGRFRIRCRAGGHAPRRIMETAAAAGWGPYELIPEQDSLEQTFMRLTRGDAPGGAAPEGGA